VACSGFGGPIVPIALTTAQASFKIKKSRMSITTSRGSPPIMEPTQELIDDIYRERVLCARRTPIEQKILAGGDLFEGVCERMAAGLRDENPGADEDKVQELLRHRLALLRRLESPVR
jgi:hypothetical protein